MLKPRRMGEQGGIVEAEVAVYSSKVQIGTHLRQTYPYRP